MTKANNDGWIRHRGGALPVAPHVEVEVRLRSGTIARPQKAVDFRWDHRISGGDIMAYRLHKPEAVRPTEANPRVVEAKSATKIMEVSVGYQAIHVRPEFDAISMRDEVNERKEEITQYLKNIEKNKERIAEIEKKLAEEGFALVEKPAEKQALPDMDDPKNWRVGDNFTCVTRANPNCRPRGFVTRVTRIEGNEIWSTDAIGSPSRMNLGEFNQQHEFHSRP